MSASSGGSGTGVRRPRIVFMGTPAFAVPSLEACRQLGEVVAVLTQPDKPRGRGQEVGVGPVKAAAEAAGLRLFQPARLKGTDIAEQLRALSPDVCVVTAYGRILPKDVLDVAPHGCINVHGSLLPRWRGAAPVQWALASGDSETGVTLMRLEEGLDTGPTFAQARTPITASDTYASLLERLAPMGAQLLIEALPKFLSGKCVPVAQPKDGITLAPPLEKEQGQLDFQESATVLERRVRAFTPWPNVFTTWQGKRLKILDAAVLPGRDTAGRIVAVGAAGLDVACREGVLRFLRVQLEGKRAMSTAEFLAGNRFAIGELPFTQQERGA